MMPKTTYRKVSCFAFFAERYQGNRNKLRWVRRVACMENNTKCGSEVT